MTSKQKLKLILNITAFQKQKKKQTNNNRIIRLKLHDYAWYQTPSLCEKYTNPCDDRHST